MQYLEDEEAVVVQIDSSLPQQCPDLGGQMEQERVFDKEME